MHSYQVVTLDLSSVVVSAVGRDLLFFRCNLAVIVLAFAPRIGSVIVDQQLVWNVVVQEFSLATDDNLAVLCR